MGEGKAEFFWFVFVFVCLFVCLFFMRVFFLLYIDSILLSKSKIGSWLETDEITCFLLANSCLLLARSNISVSILLSRMNLL